MKDNTLFEIPDAMRSLAEKNVEQVRSAYNQFLEVTRQAQQAVADSQGAATASAIEVQSRALKFTQQNIDDNFKLANDLARARDLKEYFEIQQRYAQRQIQTYAEQAQELGRMFSDAAQKVRPGS